MVVDWSKLEGVRKRTMVDINVDVTDGPRVKAAKIALRQALQQEQPNVVI